MPSSFSLTDYAKAVTADLPLLLSGLSAGLSAQGLLVAKERLQALDRADQVAVHDVLGRPASAALWAEPLHAAFKASVQTALMPPPPTQRPATQALSVEPALLSLTLKDEEEVEEEIELSRFIQHLESSAESALRDLRALAAAVRGQTEVTPESPLLHPQASASALREAVRQMPLSARARAAALQVLCECGVKPLRDAYARQLATLRERGVEPVQFRVRLSMQGGPQASAAASASTDAVPPGDAGTAGAEGHIAAVLARLVVQARHDMGGVPAGAAPPAPGQGGGSAGAMAATPASAPSSALPPALSPELADRLMRQLLQTLGQESQAAPSMREVFHRLEGPGQRLAAREPSVWQEHQHPWWLLLDRLMALCAVLEADRPGVGQQALAARCEPLITQFAEAPAPSAALCRALLDEVDTVARALVDSTQAAAEAQDDVAVPPAAAAAQSPAPAATNTTTSPAPAPLASVLRDQMAQQLRSSQAPASLRRFLLGPWVQVLTQAMDPQRGDPAQARRYTEWVDTVLGAMSPASNAQAPDLPALLALARTGLQTIGLSDTQIEPWLFDLTLRLSSAAAAEASEARDEGAMRHDELPTVPIDLQHGGVQSARARRDREAWLRSLRVGDICRVFVDTKWRTLQLVALNEDEQVYVLQGRGETEPRRLTRRALERLRGEGLATTVELGSFIAQAMDTVAAQLQDAPLRRSTRPVR